MARRRTRGEDEVARQMHQALVLHYIEERTQAEIAETLGISHASVNRLIKRGKELGLIEIKIKSPVGQFFALEDELKSLGRLDDAIVVPTVSDNPETASRAVGAAAAGYLVKQIADGDSICISGGKGTSSLVAALAPERQYSVEIVPATGLVQGMHYVNVNHVATQMAERLGGRAHEILAPLFAESADQRDLLIGMNSVASIFDKARAATLAVIGIGSILAQESSYYHLNPEADREAIRRAGATGELLAYLIDREGAVCDYSRNRTLVALGLDELRAIPRRIGVAVGANKAGSILSVLRGGYINALVTDEVTGRQVIEIAQEESV